MKKFNSINYEKIFKIYLNQSIIQKADHNNDSQTSFNEFHISLHKLNYIQLNL